MAQVTLQIDKRSYDVACDDGQEDRLRELAADLDDRIQKIRRASGENVDPRYVLVMAALFLEDELSEARAGGGAAKGNGGANEQAAEALESVAARIESIAARLEGA